MSYGDGETRKTGGLLFLRSCSLLAVVQGAGMECLINDLNNSHGVATKCQTVSGRPSSEGNMCSLCPHKASSPGGAGDTEEPGGR